MPRVLSYWFLWKLYSNWLKRYGLQGNPIFVKKSGADFSKNQCLVWIWNLGVAFYPINFVTIVIQSIQRKGHVWLSSYIVFEMAQERQQDFFQTVMACSNHIDFCKWYISIVSKHMASKPTPFFSKRAELLSWKSDALSEFEIWELHSTP